MKNLKFVIVHFLFLGSLLTANSCSDSSGYPLGDMQGAIASVKVINDSVYYLIIDDSTTLWIGETKKPNYRPNQKRALTNFTILNNGKVGYDYVVKLNDIRDILTKDIVIIANEDLNDIANDPIKVIAATISDGFLNLRISYLYGGDVQHELNIYRAESESPILQDGTIDLDFRHDRKGDADRWWQESRVCFDLRSLQLVDRDSLNLSIKLNTISGEKNIKLKYEY